MFTGIVEETGRVVSIKEGQLSIAASDVLQNMELGGSIAVNGACLTVTEFDAKAFSVDIMLETVKRTNLGRLTVGDMVNLERPLTLGKPLGGHLVQGHVDDTGRVVSILPAGRELIIRFEAPPEVMRYIVKKGFIAVDGISLTVVDLDTTSFTISVVDYTLKHTNLGSRRVGDLVNIEVDVMAKYVERLSQPHQNGITVDFLQEHGFLSADLR
jgi:riboflavin synthase